VHIFNRREILIYNVNIHESQIRRDEQFADKENEDDVGLNSSSFEEKNNQKSIGKYI